MVTPICNLQIRFSSKTDFQFLNDTKLSTTYSSTIICKHVQLQATQTLLFRSSSNFVKHARYYQPTIVGFVRWSVRKKKLYNNKIQKKAQQKKFPIDGYGIHNTARPYGPRFLLIISVGTNYCNFIYYLYSMRTHNTALAGEYVLCCIEKMCS